MHSSLGSIKGAFHTLYKKGLEQVFASSSFQQPPWGIEVAGSCCLQIPALILFSALADSLKIVYSEGNLLRSKASCSLIQLSSTQFRSCCFSEWFAASRAEQ
jgi:hypothetical protein